MGTQVGEYIVGAYLQIIEKCDFVGYNVKPQSGGIEGLSEFDVLGLRFSDEAAFMCEITTHLNGPNYGSNYDVTINKIKNKYGRQKEYADKYLDNFSNKRFMFWSPVVPNGRMTTELEYLGNDDLECIFNAEYTKLIDELRDIAKKEKKDTGNPFFRTLQILEHLRRE
ncbi:hypothetical protein [Methanococcoides alaskense]|uniref:Uncharacterized protein n=1 Tax=Methanococcoides alaskense TaxID=325778 RepID=A0AA90TXB4_9EURY|nr:hypothetical protein [Methanococcoides alaskense]MDA0525445.1 hypothetical protein [Methanococcoides alaskense]MDR6221622.1 hypothetical protein [Methanococcoides alaskense]